MKLKHISTITRTSLAILILTTTIVYTPVQAQTRNFKQQSQTNKVRKDTSTSQPTSLLKMTCKSGSPGFVQPLRSVAKEITIGREVVKEIAFLHTFYAVVGEIPMIGVDNPAIVTCRLNPQLKNLNLEFGLDSMSNLTNDKTQLLLSIYLDNNLVGEKQVVRGQKQSWSIDLKNAKNISLEAKCTENSGISNSCPGISFIDMTLK